MGESKRQEKKRTQTARRKENTGQRPELGKREAEAWRKTGKRKVTGDGIRDTIFCKG